jgi:hypothetical protein
MRITITLVRAAKFATANTVSFVEKNETKLLIPNAPYDEPLDVRPTDVSSISTNPATLRGSVHEQNV